MQREEIRMRSRLTTQFTKQSAKLFPMLLIVLLGFTTLAFTQGPELSQQGPPPEGSRMRSPHNR